MKKYFLILFLSILVFTGCKRNSLKVPVSGIDLEISVIRFEQELFEMNLDNVPESTKELNSKYQHFLSLFSYVINIGDPDDPVFADFLMAFLTNRMNNEIYLESQEVFSDIDFLEKKLTRAFKHYKYYFPEKTTPEIYTFISGFNSSIIIDTNVLGIGIDRYLGTDYEYYPRLGLPLFIRQNMHPGKIPSDCMYSWGSTEFQFGEARNNVLNNIIYQGKLNYFVKAMMPDESNHIIMGFSPEQYEWCIENEKQMWSYLIENKLLFDTDHLAIRKLVGEGPFTNYFPRESPGRAAVWLGLQIVTKYMKNSPNTSLPELMNESDYQKILMVSKYDPS